MVIFNKSHHRGRLLSPLVMFFLPLISGSFSVWGFLFFFPPSSGCLGVGSVSDLTTDSLPSLSLPRCAVLHLDH